MWTFLGLPIVLVAAVFMFQVETALPGAPDVCEEPCEATPISTVITPDSSLITPADAQATESSVVIIEPPGKSVARLEAEAAKRETAETQAKAAELLMSAEITPQLSKPRLLPFRLIVPAPRGSVSVMRGAMGYRIPLVVKQKVPSQIQGGVYVPAHETYVVLRPGHWEMVEPDKGMAETEPEADAIEAAGDVAKPEPE